MSRPLRTAFSTLLLASLPLFAKPPVVKPGLWEITLTTEHPVKTAPMTTVVCLTREQIKRWDVPKVKANSDCEPSGVGTGTTLTYTTRCTQRGRTSDAAFTFSPESYSGTVTTKDAHEEVRQVYSAKRIGDCEDPEEGNRP